MRMSLILIVVSSIVAGYLGHRFTKNEYEARLAKENERARQVIQNLNDHADDVAEQFELDRQKLVSVYEGKLRLLRKEINENPVYEQCKLPSGGMHLHESTRAELNQLPSQSEK